MNLNTTPSPRYRLVDADLLRRLMQRTSTGQSVSHRELADAVGIPYQTISQLLSGAQRSVRMEVAHGICDRLGVGVLVLFSPPPHASHITPLAGAVSV